MRWNPSPGRMRISSQYLPSGRPTIGPGGAINAASGESGAIAPGELITVYGTYLSPPAGGASPALVDGVVPTEYLGTSVSINGAAAPLLFVSPSQINAVVPFSASASSSAELKVQGFGYASEPLLLAVAPATPGLFTADGSGKGQIAALNQDGTINSASNPAGAGDVVTVFGTGFGATLPMSRDGVLANSDLLNIALPVRVTMAGQQARVTYAGSASGMISGVSQIKFEILGGLQPGAVAVVARAGDFASPGAATIAVK